MESAAIFLAFRRWNFDYSLGVSLLSFISFDA